MTATARPIPAALASTTVLVLVAGAIIAIAANAVVAFSAIAAGASSEFHPLMFSIFSAFTVIGYFAAYLGWRIVRARAAHPVAVLRVLVPVLTVLSFIPDVVVLATGFIPNSSSTAVIALALMHLVVVAVAVPVFLRVAPVR